MGLDPALLANVTPRLVGGVSQDADPAQGEVVPQIAQAGAYPNYLQSKTPEGYKGTLDLTQRQLVRFPNGLDESNSTPAAREEIAVEEKRRGEKFFPPGSYGTEFSITEPVGHQYVVMPSIFDGKVHSRKEAKQQYFATGHHMGTYPLTRAGLNQSERESQALHLRRQYLNGRRFTGD